VDGGQSPGRRRASGGGRWVRGAARGIAVHGQRLARRSRTPDPGHVGGDVDKDAGHDEDDCIHAVSKPSVSAAK
jgi:hypothetical protein